MRQETGKTNRPEPGYKVSIQLSLDGHSFSMPTLPDPQAGILDVEVLTPRTQLVPAEYFSAEEAPKLLAAAGLAPREDESVVWSDPQAEVVAVMTLPKPARERIEADSRQVRYTTPLLAASAPTAKEVRLHRTESLLYIKVFDGMSRLVLAEVIPASGEPDIRYFLERLATVFPLREYAMQVSGLDSKRICKQFGQFFRKATCA